jgi:hypothetical protein
MTNATGLDVRRLLDDIDRPFLRPARQLNGRRQG